MATLHLHTDNLGGGMYGVRHPNEADYAAVTPTAARPHPEKMLVYGSNFNNSNNDGQHQSMVSVFDAFIPPQYAQPTSMYPPSSMDRDHHDQQSLHYPQEHQQQMYTNNNFQGYASAAPVSSCSSEGSSDSSALSTGGPPTPPSTRGASPAGSFASSVPGNTIYSSGGMQHYHLQASSQQLGYDNHFSFPPHHASHPSGMVASHAAAPPASSALMTSYNDISNQQGCYGYTAPQLAYPPLHQPAYLNNQYAIYNANEASSLVAPSSTLAAAPPRSQQASPDAVYGHVHMGEQQLQSDSNVNVNVMPPALTGSNVEAFTLLRAPDVGTTAYQTYAPSRGHSASQSSISSISSLTGGSPAPSLSGSDDSGNTTKSTLSHLSFGAVGNRSNPSSRRGSISSNAGTPYGSAKNDGEKKFVCSYPGCTRAFSRNFNLSTHYNTHLGIKPFPCTHCPKSFSRRHDCARHIAAVHATESSGKRGGKAIDDDASLSPNSCGCGHTCPAHSKVNAASLSAYRGPSAFAFIKGEMTNDDDLFGSSSASSGYESTSSTTSSLNSFIGQFGNLDAGNTIYGTTANGNGNNLDRSPSLSLVPSSGFANAGFDAGFVKLEDREGE